MKFLVVFCLISTINLLEGKIFHASGSGRYSLTHRQAIERCGEAGGSLALPSEIYIALREGYSRCQCGWLADRSARYPMAISISVCGGRPGVHRCEWRDRWDAFCFVGGPVEKCSRALGMETGTIPDIQLTSSSINHAFWREPWEASRARLNNQGVVNAWMPNHDGRNQYIEVDLGRPVAITGIITQGVRRYMKNQYVKSFRIASSKDSEFWNFYSENNRTPKIFTGNHDNNGLVRNMFQHVILAQHVRIYPHTWMRHISLRFELLGCDMSVYDELIEKKRENDPDVSGSLQVE